MCIIAIIIYNIIYMIIQIDFVNGYNAVLDIRLFEWNKTELSKRIGKCDNAMEFLLKYATAVDLDGKVIADDDICSSSETGNITQVDGIDDDLNVDPDAEQPSPKRRRIEHRDPMDDEILKKKRGIHTILFHNYYKICLCIFQIFKLIK